MKRQKAGLLYSIVPLLVLLLTAITAIVKNDPHPGSELQSRQKFPGFLPSDWMENQRTFPYGTIRTSAYLEAVRQARDIHGAAGRSNFEWEFAGPLNIGGRITDIEVPDGNFSTIFVAAASGGILKTTNNGASWTNIFKDQAAISIGDIAISQQDPDLMFAGSGEANSSSQSFRGDGIYKSTDGGTTWQHSGLELSAYIGRIVIDHSNGDRVFAAACGNLFTPDENRGVYRTTDGGNSWERVLFISDSTSAIDLIQHPSNPDILYAAMWERMRGLNYRRSFGVTSGIWKTTDGGDTWTELTTGLPQGSETGRIGLAISPSSPSVLYAFYDNQSEVAVYKTQNGGQSWTRTSDGYLQGMNSSFGWYFGQIRVDPDSPDKLFVLGVYLYYSSDGGSSWSETGYEMHVDHHALFIHPITGRIYEGNDGGLYFSDDTGFSWSKINNLPLTQFYDIEIDHLNPERIYGGTQDNNTIRTMTGQLGDWEAILGGDGFYSLVDYTNPNIIYAEYQWGALHKSTNGGNWMDPINGYWSSDRVNWSAPVIMHPQEPQILYFGTYRVWRTTNGGNSWNAISNDLTLGDDGSTFHTISTLAISSVEPGIVLAGTDDGRVHISTNGGSLWNDISNGLPERWITRVVADPFDLNTIYVTLSGFRWDEPLAHVYKSTNLGQTWQPISSDLPELPVNALVADPGQQGRLFIATDAGVFLSENSGETWQSMNQGIGNVPVTSMKIHPDENFLIIGTYGLSAYKFDLNQLNVGVEENPQFETTLSLTGIYPNPARAGKDIRMTIGTPIPAMSAFSILDMHGRIIRESGAVQLFQGMNSIVWDGMDQSGKPVKPGTYLIVVKSGRLKATAKVLVAG
ncbi:MAG: T9SS type A sorting domain-containing protein [Bacteroidales bacterium]|nr:T9SS type A sorting domain-containing protein [Bacteroidales bacterium]